MRGSSPAQGIAHGVVLSPVDHECEHTDEHQQMLIARKPELRIAQFERTRDKHCRSREQHGSAHCATLTPAATAQAHPGNHRSDHEYAHAYLELDRPWVGE